RRCIQIERRAQKTDNRERERKRERDGCLCEETNPSYWFERQSSINTEENYIFFRPKCSVRFFPFHRGLEAVEDSPRQLQMPSRDKCVCVCVSVCVCVCVR